MAKTVTKNVGLKNEKDKKITKKMKSKKLISKSEGKSNKIQNQKNFKPKKLQNSLKTPIDSSKQNTTMLDKKTLGINIQKNSIDNSEICCKPEVKNILETETEIKVDPELELIKANNDIDSGSESESKNEDDESKNEDEVEPIETLNDKKNLKKPTDPENKEKTVFVGNLPANTKANQLKNLFSKCTVSSCRFRLSNGKPILKHKMRKDSNSINAWVVFENIKDVETAIKLNGKEFKGHHIRVTKSNEKVADGKQDNKCTIFIGNLKYSATDEKLYSIFSSCGEIQFVRTIQNAKGCCGVAYVCFKTPESVCLALELNKTLLDDRPMNVERYSQNKSGASKNRKPEKELNGVEKRIMSKLSKDKRQKNDISKLQKFNNFRNKKGDEMGKKFPPKNFNNKNERTMNQNKKKFEFRGVKVDNSKKFKKKINRSPFQALAKKIAPKD